MGYRNGVGIFVGLLMALAVSVPSFGAVPDDTVPSGEPEASDTPFADVYRGFPAYVQLSYDKELIEAVGLQKPSMCSAFSLAYARTILDGEIANPYAYWMSGLGACWRAAGYTADAHPVKCDLLRETYEEVRNGRPVIVYVNGDYSASNDRRAYAGHYVTVIGYRALTNPDDLKPSDLLALDSSPWGHGKAFVINDNQFQGTTRMITTSGEGVPLDFTELNETFDVESVPFTLLSPWSGDDTATAHPQTAP